MSSNTRRQLRSFVIIWTFLSLMMGMGTFLAIFFRYQPVQASNDLTLNQAQNQAVIVSLPATTIEPTLPPTIDSPALANPAETAVEVIANNPIEVAQAASTLVAQAEETPPENDGFQPPDENDTYQVGIQLQVPQDLNQDVLDGYMRSVKQDLGLDWYKKQVRWEDIEPQPGVYNWAELDLLFNRSLYWQLNVMISVVTAPDWAREPGANLEQHGPPANNAAYVNFVRQIFLRYPGQVFALEVWNEQNLDREWTSVNGLSAANYVSLLRDVYNMTQVESSGTIVISGALSPTGFDNGINAIDDFRYMQQMIDNGMLDVVDCVGVHHNGYNIGPNVLWDAVPPDPTATFRGPFDNPHHSWSFRSTLEGYSQRISAAGYDKKLCVTEFGWASTEDLTGTPRGFGFADDNTLEEQANFIVEALNYMENSGNVWLAFIWNFNYGPQAGWDPSNDNVPYSLIGPDFRFRPAYDAVREWQRGYRARMTGLSG